MKYDDASWHYGGDFPRDLPEAAGATHIAMFLSWAVLNNLVGELHTSEFPEHLVQLQNREITPVEWFLQVCDEKFTDEDLNEEGNRFAVSYYGNDSGIHVAEGSYLSDYDRTFSGCETLYHFPDSWASHDTIGRVIESRLAEWRKGR